MEGALAAKTVMIVVFVAHCGAVPTTSPSQEELSKAKVKHGVFSVGVLLLVLFNQWIISGREETSVFLCDSVRTILCQLINNKVPHFLNFVK